MQIQSMVFVLLMQLLVISFTTKISVFSLLSLHLAALCYVSFSPWNFALTTTAFIVLYVFVALSG